LDVYSLNFNGRVLLPSIKNFQLVELENCIYANANFIAENISLQFGRADEDMFNLDLKYPFSIFQAFSVALSSFDFKYACD